MGTGALFPGVKRPGRETDHSPTTSAEITKIWIYTSTPHTSLRRSAWLVKHRANFTFYIIILVFILLTRGGIMNRDIINVQAMPLVPETLYWWAFAFRQWSGSAERKKDLYSRTTHYRVSYTSTRGSRLFVDCVAVCSTSTTNSFPGSAELKNTWSYTSNPRMVWRLISHSNRYSFQFYTNLLAWRKPTIDYCWRIF
jgi:hypothetical protein